MCLRGEYRVGTIVLAVLFCVACPTLMVALAQDTQPRTDRVSGTVVNSVTGEPIERALVVSPDQRFATMTDSYGRFEFIFPQSEAGQGTSNAVGALSTVSGIHRPDSLTARKPGFLTDSYDSVQNVRATSGKDIIIPLIPEAIIVGHVALPTSEAPDRIEVELCRRQVRSGRAQWVSVQRVVTRSDGEFRFAALNAGSYKLFTHESLDRDPEASAPGGQMYGYAPVYFPAASDFASAAAVQLTPGKIVHVDLSLVRQPYHRIKVLVRNAPPGIGLSVDVSLQGRGGPGYSLAYNPREQAVIGLLPNGSYTLTVVSNVPATVSGSLNITVHGPLEGPTLTVVSTPPISVHVKEEFTSAESKGSDSGGSPAGNFNLPNFRRKVNVTLEPADDFGPRGPQRGSSVSGVSDDSFALENVHPGRFWVRIHPVRGYASSVTSGGVDLLHQPLLVPVGVSIPQIDITLRDDTARIEGTIEGLNASPGESNSATGQISHPTEIPAGSPNLHVYFIPLPNSSGSFSEVNVSPDGSFISPPLPPGVYRSLAFSHPQPDLEYEDSEAMRAYDGKGEVVRLAGGQVERIRLQLVSTSD